MNPRTGNGGTCYGDSGGPNFLGTTNIVAAITITGDAVCRSTNVVYRLDTRVGPGLPRAVRRAALTAFQPCVSGGEDPVEEPTGPEPVYTAARRSHRSGPYERPSGKKR